MLKVRLIKLKNFKSISVVSLYALKVLTLLNVIGLFLAGVKHHSIWFIAGSLVIGLVFSLLIKLLWSVHNKIFLRG